MSAVGLTENVKGDVRKFEIWYSGREVVYIVQVFDPLLILLLHGVPPPLARALTHLSCVVLCVCACLVQAPTVEVKVAWLTEIRKILTNQLKLRQGLYGCCNCPLRLCLLSSFKRLVLVCLTWIQLCLCEVQFGVWLI